MGGQTIQIDRTMACATFKGQWTLNRVPKWGMARITDPTPKIAAVNSAVRDALSHLDAVAHFMRQKRITTTRQESSGRWQYTYIGMRPWLLLFALGCVAYGQSSKPSPSDRRPGNRRSRSNHLHQRHSAECPAARLPGEVLAGHRAGLDVVRALRYHRKDTA